MAVLLSRRIRCVQAFIDGGGFGWAVVFGEGAVICFCLLHFHSGGRAESLSGADAAGGLGASSSGDGGTSFALGNTDGRWICSGAGVGYVFLSFVAKGNRLVPATHLLPGLLLRLATVGSFSVWRRLGRQDRFSSSSFGAVRMAVFFQRNRGAGGGLRCWLLQLLPKSWSPPARWKVELAGLPLEEVAGVEADEGNIHWGCVCVFYLYRGVSCKITGMYCFPM
ncbi:hypothetical protein PVAP13_3KG488001 [Panicum virgatum]|uniref:Uncharacterized protein n=1 Tax=Panicum virgatum TaxID=38727 RepID=A0A8T0V174_PANVG|nr:hypothetical protein PVAP13_3KG488001 [Panicum virgatum]